MAEIEDIPDIPEQDSIFVTNAAEVGISEPIDSDDVEESAAEVVSESTTVSMPSSAASHSMKKKKSSSGMSEGIKTFLYILGWLVLLSDLLYLGLCITGTEVDPTYGWVLFGVTAFLLLIVTYYVFARLF